MAATASSTGVSRSACRTMAVAIALIVAVGVTTCDGEGGDDSLSVDKLISGDLLADVPDDVTLELCRIVSELRMYADANDSEALLDRSTRLVAMAEGEPAEFVTVAEQLGAQLRAATGESPTEDEQLDDVQVHGYRFQIARSQLELACTLQGHHPLDF